MRSLRLLAAAEDSCERHARDLARLTTERPSGWESAAAALALQVVHDVSQMRAFAIQFVIDDERRG